MHCQHIASVITCTSLHCSVCILRQWHKLLRSKKQILPAVALLSLQAQIQAGATNNKPMQLLQYGPEGPVDSSKCTAVCFIPGSEGTVFAAAHLSGTVIIQIKVPTRVGAESRGMSAEIHSCLLYIWLTGHSVCSSTSQRHRHHTCQGVCRTSLVHRRILFTCPAKRSRCTVVCFIPGLEGTEFAAAHLSGTVSIHIKLDTDAHS